MKDAVRKVKQQLSVEAEAKRTLHMGIEDIVYAWSLEGAPIDNLMEDIYDYVIETYGPPF